MDLLPLFLEDDEELLAYHLLKKKSHSYYLEKTQTAFNLDSLTDEFCWVNFRFFKADVKRLKLALGIPLEIKCGNSLCVSGTEALCILLKRQAYPNRYADLMNSFPRTRCELSRICNFLIKFILDKHGHLLKNLRWVTQEHLRTFSEALVNKGSPYKNCVGFLDGTVRPICRPSVNQREFYNGHRRVHAIKFQSLVFPNGLIGNLYGPVPGRRHDAYLLATSGLIRKMRTFSVAPGPTYHIYGDPAYPLLPSLIVPFKGQNLSLAQQRCNRKMSSIRESVEWGFAKVLQLFAFLDYKKNLKVHLQDVGKFYLVGSILTNCHTCIYGSQTSIYFNCEPPSLDTYLNY